MEKSAVMHRPYSEYGFALTSTKIVIRLRAKRDDLKNCNLYYGDRMDPNTPIAITKIEMKRIYQDGLFDYFEAVFDINITRVCYYFKLTDTNNESVYYYNNAFHNEVVLNRQLYYNFHYVREEDIADVPEWAKNAIIYQIYPDSFATLKAHISKAGMEIINLDGSISKSKFGGTLKGITQNLDYIENLGITCIYLTPIFKAQSWHKYDTIDYFEIDPCLGTKSEFREFVKECHRRSIKVILDGVFNHSSPDFFAFKDILEKGNQSKYVDWYYIKEFPIVTEPKPNYECFAYVATMPKLNTSNDEVKKYILDIATYWIKEFDIDGWRLDVANEVNLDFWRAYRQAVKSVKSDALLIGEIWDDAHVFLQGDQFDSAMNYNLYFACRDFFAERIMDAKSFADRVQYLLTRYKTQIQEVQMNLIDSHDVSRFLSMVGDDIRRLKLGAIFLLTHLGIPMIFYGDEQGINGIEEIDYRKPMNWESQDESLFKYYKKLIQLRKDHMNLMLGQYRTLIAEGSCYGYSREDGDEKLIIIFNNSDHQEKQALKLDIDVDQVKDYLEDKVYDVQEGEIIIDLAPYESAVILLK
ncbi:MAG: alpha-glycosidase [Cellulosilyticum sp.]|nr:alpha-glycosidase [Cellulosilyticum sp.]